MAVTYSIGSEENRPDLYEVNNKVSADFKVYLQVRNKVSAGFYNLRLNKKISAKFSSKRKIKKNIYPGFASYDQETLEMFGEI